MGSIVGEYQLARQVHHDEWVEFVGIIDREVVSRSYYQEVVVMEPRWGMIQLRVPRFPQYRYGDEVLVSCDIKHPDADHVQGDFNYGRYLRIQGIDWVCEDVHIQRLRYRRRYTWRAGIIWLRQQVGEVVSAIWPEPHASLIAGILYGARVGLPDDIKEQFSHVGLTHIMAVSGYNVTIVASVVMALLRGVGIGRKQAFGFVGVGVGVFVLFVGASASAVRAGIMGVVALLGKTLGRGSAAAPVLVISALLMSLHTPLVLMYDVGFHLSMVATIGLIYGSPIIEGYLGWMTSRFGLREIVSTSVSAIIFTAPIIAFVFGSLSLVSLLANIIVLPVIPILMMSAAVSAGIGLIWQLGGVISGMIAWAISGYVLMVVRWFSQLSWVQIHVQISLVGVCIAYSILLVWVYWHRKKSLI